MRSARKSKETPMSDTLRTLRSYADAWTRNDVAALAARYADEFTLHYPGAHSLSGVHRGKPAALQILLEVSRRVTRRLTEVVDVMAGEQRGAIQVIEEWRREEEVALLDRVLVYTVRGELLTECWLFDENPGLVAHFLRDPRA
jgi:uncharacterized protein